MKVWVARVSHRHGTDTYVATTEERLRIELFLYCQEWWGKWDLGREPKWDKILARTGKKRMHAIDVVLDRYFGDRTEEWMDIDEVEVLE